MPQQVAPRDAPPPICSCHGEPMRWWNDITRSVGGAWRCRVKHPVAPDSFASDTDTTRRCRMCGEDKQLDCFYPDARRPRGYMARCKECDCRVGRERYAKKIGRTPRPWGLSKKKLCLDCGAPTTNGAQRCWGCYTASRIRDRRTPCKVEGCGRSVGEHGKIGYCSPHYQRKKAYGDPLHRPSPKPKKPRSCRVNWARCAACSRKFIKRHGAHACPECRETPEWRRRWDKTERKEYCERTCPECATRFTPRSRTTIYCSKRCRDRQGRLRLRARKRDAYREDVWRSRIYERDGWKCQLCGHALARQKTVPHPQAPTIDHIVPLSCGGTHEPANVQAAHFICNSKKSAHGCGSQLLLVG